MKVKLLRDIRENITINALGQPTGPGTLKVSVHRGRAFEFRKGAVLQMSDASAQKYIDAKVAEKTDDPVTEPRAAKPGEGGAALSAG
jgi:hypothetical protein